MTLSGFVLLTSHTTTTPSCDATANFDPLDENAVENDAGTGPFGWRLYKYGETVVIYGARDSLVVWVNVIRAPPVIRWRYTSGESPTDNNVLPSGDIDAVVDGYYGPFRDFESAYNDLLARPASTSQQLLVALGYCPRFSRYAQRHRRIYPCGHGY